MQKESVVGDSIAASAMSTSSTSIQFIRAVRESDEAVTGVRGRPPVATADLRPPAPQIRRQDSAMSASSPGSRRGADASTLGAAERSGEPGSLAPARAGLVLVALIVVAGVANLNLSV